MFVFILFIAIVYFLWHSFVKKKVFELISYIAIVCLLNCYFIYQIIYLIVANSDNDKDIDSLMLTETILGYIGLFGCILVILFVLSVAQPMYESISEDIFLKIGANNNMWDVYKYYSLSKSLIKLDLVFNTEFMLTVFFLMYYDLTTYYYLAIDIFAYIAMLFVNFYGHIIISRKMVNQFPCILIIRLLIEIFKVFKTVIVILGYDAAFNKVDSDAFDAETYQFYKWAILVLEFFSFICSIMMLYLIQVTFRTFKRTEFDIIRNKLTGNYDV
jgi:hypothetical protein